MRVRTRKSTDRKVFKRTANRTKAVNVLHVTGRQRGGSRF